MKWPRLRSRWGSRNYFQWFDPPPLFILFIMDADTHILVTVHCCALLWYCRADRKRMLFVVHQRPARRWFHVNEAPPHPPVRFTLPLSGCRLHLHPPPRHSARNSVSGRSHKTQPRVMLPPPPFIWLRCRLSPPTPTPQTGIFTSPFNVLLIHDKSPDSTVVFILSPVCLFFFCLFFSSTDT